MSISNNKSKTNGNVCLKTELSEVIAKVYVAFVGSVLLGAAVCGLFIIWEVAPSDITSLFDNSKLREIIKEGDSRIKTLETEITSLEDQNAHLKEKIKKSEEDLEKVLQELKQVKNNLSNGAILVLLVLFGVTAVCIRFSLPDVETILLAPVKEEEFIRGLYWQLQCAVSVLSRTNRGELPSLEEQNYDNEDIEWLKAHLKFMVRLAQCFRRGLKD